MDFSLLRNKMVKTQLIPRGIKDEAVLEAMRTVPRELFVDEQVGDLAYIDGPLGIDCGQTISQPYIVALMAELLELDDSKTVLEIGTGSGYAAAVLSQIAKEVYTVERHASLAQQAEECFFSLGYDNIYVSVCDGTLGWPDFAPYDSILVSAAAPTIPESLKSQLKVGGVLVIPLGNMLAGQWLLYVKKKAPNSFRRTKICPVRFVPLIGEDGWKDRD